MKTIVVYDTNILISGLFWKGAPKRTLTLAREEHVTGITSKPLLAELSDVLTRSKSPFRLASQELERVLKELDYLHIVVPTRTITICRDRKDNQVLEAAAAGQANYIVTGDPDLLVLEQFEETKIVNAALLLELVEQENRAE